MGSNSSGYDVFRAVDTSLASVTKNCAVPKNTAISIELASAATVKVYIAANNNGDGKGTVSAVLGTTSVGTYSLPNRQDETATPFEITTTTGGTLVLTNSYQSLLYKVVVSGGANPDVPVVNYSVPVKVNNSTATATELTIGTQSVEVPANGSAEKTLSLPKGNYSIGSSVKTLKANPSAITVEGDVTTPIAIEIEECDFPVIVTDATGGYIDGFDTIKSALSSASVVNGCVISLQPGYYNENINIAKSITLKKMDNTEGEVIIYGHGSGENSMNPTIYTNAPNVKLEGITAINDLNVSYGNIKASTTGCDQAAAFTVEGDGAVINNCKFMSVQDTINTYHYSSGKPSINIEFNNCSFYGSTDYICGGNNVNFNNCEFVVYTGDAAKKTTGYIFAPSSYANWNVNGGVFRMDENSTITKLYYARAWEERSSDTQTLNIYGVDNRVTTGIEGIMGFCGATGGGRSHSITAFHFNIYEGKDNTSDLLATSYITGVDMFEMSSNPIINVATDGSTKLLIGDFGANVSDKFIKNVLPDITEIGFVSADNASSDKISDTNTIKTTTLYKRLYSSDGTIPEINALDNAYIGAGILQDITGEQTITVVPYVKYDATYDNDSKNLDVNPVYKFGAPVQLTVTNN